MKRRSLAHILRKRWRLYRLARARRQGQSVGCDLPQLWQCYERQMYRAIPSMAPRIVTMAVSDESRTHHARLYWL